jgi:hypothetical protein
MAPAQPEPDSRGGGWRRGSEEDLPSRHTTPRTKATDGV